ncbi:MAG: NHL repeat-containing protein [Vulcanimicrobiaceae bacterium]
MLRYPARRAAGALLVVALAGCGGGGSSSSTSIGSSPIDPPVSSSSQHLYVGDGVPGSGTIRIYALPIASSSTPVATIPLAAVDGVAVSAQGVLAASLLDGQIAIIPSPLTSPAISAEFSNGANGGQLAFLNNGELAAAAQDANLRFFAAPYTNASTPNASFSLPGATFYGVAQDGSGDIIADDQQNGNIYWYSSGAATPTVVPGPPNADLRSIVVQGSQAFIANVTQANNKYQSFPGGDVLVYNLPLSAASVPAYTIGNGMDIPEGLAFDAAGNLYVTNLGVPGTSPEQINVYAPPLSATSTPAAQLAIPQAGLFSIAVGP